jgi:hypothetical protein
VRVAGATSSAPAAARVVGRLLGVGDLEGDPKVRADTTAHLDPVDQVDLGRVGQLERRPAGIEDGHLLAGVAVDLELDVGAEDVAVEAQRLVVVGGLDHEPHLQDALGRSVCHEELLSSAWLRRRARC